jgi:hypothetical protein
MARKRPLKKSAKTNTAKSDKDVVTIRMYCQGLGDCFLLSFPRKTGETPYKILIDCGVLQKTPDEAERLRHVAEDLFEVTEGKIDLLVITHEHWDHIAGFSHANDVFSKIKFGHVWLSWAENPNDPDAQIVKKELGKKKSQVKKALKVAGMLGLSAKGNSSVEQELRTTEQIMNFIGPDESSSETFAAAAKAPKKGVSSTSSAKKKTLGETMDWLREKVDASDWCVPGEVRSLYDVEGVKVYVLGPPKSTASIRKMDPSGNQGYRQLTKAASFMGAVDSIADDPNGNDTDGPFDALYGINESDARIDPFFREFYGFDDDHLADHDNAWRRIDGAWLGGVGQLALQLDTGINNTSLALAFELPDGRTLIFPGDAQIGNWLSWDDVTFKNGAGSTVPMTSKKLLNRAVFYKVGHHGSHNATRKEGGLEEMTSGDLMAMIPTDETFALTQSPPHGWKMPFHDLYVALKEYTNSRIARADFDESQMPQILDDPNDQSPAWKKFSKGLRFSKIPLKPKLDRPLWVECDIPF